MNRYLPVFSKTQKNSPTFTSETIFNLTLINVCLKCKDITSVFDLSSVYLDVFSDNAL